MQAILDHSYTEQNSANFPGYPQSNITYDPDRDRDRDRDRDYGGNHNHFLTRGPRGQTGYIPSVFFHEQGHAENFHMYSGEHEAVVNFLWVAVHNKKFDVDLQTAFRTSRYNFDTVIIDGSATRTYSFSKGAIYTETRLTSSFTHSIKGQTSTSNAIKRIGLLHTSSRRIG